MNNLSYSQKKEVEQIIKDELDRKNFFETFKSLLEKFEMEQMIRKKAETIVPSVAQNWAENNLRVTTESVTNNYMRNNFQRFFRQEISENREVNGFIADHLRSVENTVENTANRVVSKIVDSNLNNNPVFQSCLRGLAEHNTKQLDTQADTIRRNLSSLDKSIEDNRALKERLDRLESESSFYTTLSVLSFAGSIGLLVKLFSQSKL